MLGEPSTAEVSPKLLPRALIGTTAMVSATFAAGLIGAFTAVASAFNIGGLSMESVIVIVAAFVVVSVIVGGLNGLFFRYGQRHGPSVIVKNKSRYIVGMCVSSILSIILQSVVVPICALLGSIGGESLVGGFLGAGFGMFAVAAAIGRVSSDAFVRFGALTSIKPGDKFCLMCNYDLRGSASPHCPECGARIPPRETGPADVAGDASGS